MVQVDDQTKKQRSTEAARTAVESFHREQYIGQKYSIIVSEQLSGKNGRWFAGKTTNYLQVLIETDPGLSCAEV